MRRLPGSPSDPRNLFRPHPRRINNRRQTSHDNPTLHWLIVSHQHPLPLIYLRFLLISAALRPAVFHAGVVHGSGALGVIPPLRRRQALGTDEQSVSVPTGRSPWRTSQSIQAMASIKIAALRFGQIEQPVTVEGDRRRQRPGFENLTKTLVSSESQRLTAKGATIADGADG